MTAMLRLVLDQIAEPADGLLAQASRELTRALVETAPTGCAVEGIVPAGGVDAARAAQLEVRELTVLPKPRRELARAWQRGTSLGIDSGMIHSPTLMAPLVRPRRGRERRQTVVTLWDLRAWEHPDELPKAEVAWQRAMLTRASRLADAIIVPTHAAAEAVARFAPVRGRVRVVSGAAPDGFRVPADEVGRRRHLALPASYVAMSGDRAPSSGLRAGLGAAAASALPAVVLDVPSSDVDSVREWARDAGLADADVHVFGVLDMHDRAAVMAGAVAWLATAVRTEFPWRVVEALAAGAPVVAAASDVHREVIVDGGLIAPGSDAAALGEALRSVHHSPTDRDRLAVLSADRGRAFSWHGAAERVWHLHAEL